MNKKMGRTGIIGKSGTWYKCESSQHLITSYEHEDDAPFVWCYGILSRGVTCHTIPNRKQYETTLDWCSDNNMMFEDTAIGPEWEIWLS